MHESFRRILTGAIFFAITIAIAIMGYVTAGWSLLDAVYMVVITVFGVGYGEVRPIQSPELRVFTMFVIIAGTSSAVYMVGGMVQMVTEGEINRALGIHRMMKTINLLENHVIICGFGRMGQILAREMTHAKMPFVVVDSSGDRTTEAGELDYLIITGDATDEDVLRLAGIYKAKFLASVLPDDALNVFITLTARGLNPNLVILARGEFPTTEHKLKLAGADHVVLPATIGAYRLVHMIKHPAALDWLDRNDGSNSINELLGQMDIQLDELAVPEGSAIIGGMIRDVEVRGNKAFLIVALRRADGLLLRTPPSTTLICIGDTIIVMGHRGDIPSIAADFSLKRQMRYRGARH